MSRRLDLGVAVYSRDAGQVRRTLRSIADNSTCDVQVWMMHNPCEGDESVREVLCDFASRDQRFIPMWMPANVGYAGAVNRLFAVSATEYVAYCDCDVYIGTPSWDETLCGYLDRYHELGMVFPNGGAYPIQRAGYTEIMWACGFCWVINRLCMREVGDFDTTLGHQEEADYTQRVRMAGWKCACASEVSVQHEAKSTNNPANVERINQGVRAWVNKWTRYFGGKNLNYHSPNVLRFEDWPPQALYLEEWWSQKLPGLNATPEVVVVEGREYDLVRVPRFKDFYRGRII